MPTMYDVQVNDLLIDVAKELKELQEITAPEWAMYVKTGVHKERPPQDPDWWYLRSASVLRAVRMKGPIGVSKLRKKYGGRKNRGHKPDAFRRGSGNILRKVLQQLEKAGLVRHMEKGVHKGRIATPRGISLLDQSAVKLYKPIKKAQPQQKEAVTEAAK
ncbi:30S ribosomal protein S19e [Thermoproteota archaeon]